MTKQEKLIEALKSTQFNLLSIEAAYDEVTVECDLDTITHLLRELKNNSDFGFDQLMDLCAVDYLLYGESDWETEAATDHGFSRAVEQPEPQKSVASNRRFAVIYHLLSTVNNQRLRVKVFCHDDTKSIPSVHEIWKSANWFEREAYDLYGVLFTGHPDLRRILTDYGFIGHPFCKDFPVSGHVEMRYDAKSQKVIYEPVDLEPRTLEPRVIRSDNRYLHQEGISK
ncbi:MAG: NADH-quinone oxidoreductase subunit C [Legionellaceae bacterium]|nr:NADH-quinone oxidoreductase subunit C [Legionellaceae bacterium]